MRTSCACTHPHPSKPKPKLMSAVIWVKAPRDNWSIIALELAGSVAFLNPNQLKPWLIPVRTNVFHALVMIDNTHDKQDSYLRMHP